MIERYVTNTYQITDTYKIVLIDAKDATVKIEASNDDSTKLVFFEDKKSNMFLTCITIRLRFNRKEQNGTIY